MESQRLKISMEAKLGFDKIRENLRNRCQSPLGIEWVEEMTWRQDHKAIRQDLDWVQEMMYLLRLPDTFPSTHYYDCRQTIIRSQIEGAVVDEASLRDLKLALQTINQIILFLKKSKDDQVFRLWELASHIKIDVDLLKSINKVIDETGKVRDTASKELFSLRQDLRQEQAALRKRLDGILQSASHEGLAPDDMSITVRNGRMVIPLFAEYKRKWKGLVHGESATGQTIFIEPIEVFEANNRVFELENEERREVLRILRALTAEISQHAHTLQSAINFLGHIDFLRAKALFALSIQATVPTLVADQTLQWVGVKHPLLEIAAKTQHKTVVPLTLQLPEHARMLVISGPNAGGKSVVLKTIGLLQYMVQCGLPIPGGETSLVGIFHDMYIDIGDQQSIENDLSTYSSHLLFMKHVLVAAGSKSLVLLDEFGTGTDPQYGGAIAEAMLEQLLQNKAWVIVNTHYANIKHFAQHTPTVVNAGMLFDTEKLTPLYQLQIGKPGHSFALEIARKIGLPQELLDKAAQKIGVKQVKADQLLHTLSQEKEALYKQMQALQTERENLKITSKQYELLKQNIEKNKSEILEKARKDSRKIVAEAKEQMQILIKQLKNKKTYDAKEAELLKQQVQDTLQKLNTSKENPPLPDETSTVTKTPIQVGDWVMVKDKQGYYKVLELREKDATVGLGEMHSIVKRSKLIKVNGQPSGQKNTTRSTTVRGIDITDRLMHFQPSLDLRGKRAEQALYELEGYIDNALLLGVYEIRIIHGKGNGVLCKVIREQLKRSPYVADIHNEPMDRGGDGVSVVVLK